MKYNQESYMMHNVLQIVDYIYGISQSVMPNKSQPALWDHETKTKKDLI